MENTNIPASEMLTKKDIADPRNKWTMLGSDKWKYDFGLLNHLINRCGDFKGNYLFAEKRYKTLNDLLLSIDSDCAEAIIEHYGYPEPKYFMAYLRFAWDSFAAGKDWNVDNRLNQMDYFPHSKLYADFCKSLSKENI